MSVGKVVFEICNLDLRDNAYDMQESSTFNIPEELTALLSKLFEDELRDIYWAEKTLVKTLMKMAKNATSGDLFL